MVVVQAHVEKRPAVVGPHDATAGIGDAVGQVEAGGDVAQADGVKLRAFVVGRIGQQVVIRTLLETAKVPVRLALSLAVAVEQDDFLAALARLPADERILAAGDETAEIGERSIWRRH